MSAKKKNPEELKKQLGIAQLLAKTNEVTNKVKANAASTGIALSTGQNTAKIGGSKAALTASKIAALPKSYKDFTSAADYLADLDRAAGGVATSDQIKATMEQLRKEQGLYLNDVQRGIDGFINSPIPKAIGSVLGTSGAKVHDQVHGLVDTRNPYQTYYDDLSAAYSQRKEQERQAALAPYINLRGNADYDAVVRAGLAKDQKGFSVDPMADARSFMGGYSTPHNSVLSATFQESLQNPALWAAQNSEELLKADASYTGSAKGLTDSTANFLYMSDDELKTYTYLLETAGRQQADKYYDLLSDDLSQRRLNTRYQSQAQWAKEHPWAASALSLATSPLQGVSYIAGLGQRVTTGDIDINSSWMAPAQLTQSLREGATSNVYNKYSALEQEILSKEMSGQKVSEDEYARLDKLRSRADTLNFLANTGFSVADSAISILAGGGGAGTMALMGGEAAGSTMYSSLRSGKTADQALLDGGISAMIEAATEKIPLDNLKALSAANGSITKGGVKKFLWLAMANAPKQGVTEGVEEAVSEYANTLYDIIRYGDQSEYNKYYRDLLEDGVDADEAEELTAYEFFVNRPAQSGAGGFVSGLFFGTAGSAISTYNNARIRNQGDLTAATEASARDTAATMLNMTEAQRTAADTLAEISRRDNAGQSTIADVVASKILTGTNPTNSEIRKLRDASGPVQKAFETMTGIKLTGVDSSTLRAAIGAAAKNPTIDMGLAGQYFGVVNELAAQMPAVSPAATQYDDLTYNSPDVSAIGSIDAARQGGAPLDVASAPDIGSAANMVEDFREKRRNAVDNVYTDPLRKGLPKLSEDALSLQNSQLATALIDKIEGTSEYDELKAIADEAGISPRDLVVEHWSGNSDPRVEDIVRRANAPKHTNNASSVRKNESSPGLRGKDDDIQLSPTQAEYFKDSVIRDSEGRLLRMYHGSPATFTVFDGSKSLYGLFGYGSYFTSDDQQASAYMSGSRTGRIYEVFLNIKSPCDADQAVELDKWDKVCESLGVDSAKLRSKLGVDAVNADALEALDEMVDDASRGEWADAMESAGWDGVISRRRGNPLYRYDNPIIAVAFRPNQIKRTDNRNPTDNADIRFRRAANQYDAPELEDALKEDALNDAQLANLTGQLRDRGIDLSDDPDTQELLEAVDMLDNMEPGFELNITERPYKTAEQKAAEKAEREKAAVDRAERKRLADEEKQRKAEEAEKKKAAIAERRAAQEKKKAAQEKKKAKAEAEAAKNRIQREIVNAAKDNISGTMRIKGSGKDAYSVNIVDIKRMVRSLSGDARAEVMKQLETINQLGKAFGHSIRYFSGKMTGVDVIPPGFYHNGIIYANVNYLRAAGVKTVAHEICHDIAASEPSFVSTFYKLYREYCESNGLMSEFNRRWDEVYNNSLYPNKQLAIAEEVLAEMFGEYAENDSDFLNYCMGKRPGIVARIVEAFNRLLTKLHLKRYSKAAQDAMKLRNYMLGVMAQHQLRRTDRSVRLSSAVRSDYAAAQRKADAIGDRYAVRGDAGVHLAQWDTTGLASPEDYKNLRRTAPDEITTYGFKIVPVNGEPRNVLIVNPSRYITEGYHADMVASSRSLAAALGIRLGFITGQTTQTVGEGRKRRDITIDADYLLTNDGTLFINLDSEVPYNKIVAGAWWSQYRKKHPQSARNMERLVERVNKLRGGTDTIARNAAVDMLAGKAVARSVRAINMDVDSLAKALADNKSAAYAYAHENPGIMRRMFESAGDMVAKLTKKQDYRAAYLGGQLQARLMKAFSESSHDPNRRGGDRIESDGRRKAPENVRFMFAGENARTADRAALDRAKTMLESGADSETVRQETGWFKGMDGKWRFEIDDSSAEYHRAGDARFSRVHADYARHQALLEKMLNGQISPEEHAELRDLDEIWGRERGRLNERVDRGNATLDEILDHEALFEAYPELRNVKVRFGNMSDGARGEYDYKTNTIKLRSDLRGAPADTLLHEIQHAVQGVEGFARGASEDYWKQQRAEIDEILAGARNNLNLWLNSIGYKEQVQKSIDEVMKGKKSLDQHWEDMEAFKANSKYACQIATSEAEIAEYVRQRREITGGLTAYEQYLNTAGEIEARDTAARSSLAPEQRKNTRPDIDREDVVFGEKTDAGSRTAKEIAQRSDLSIPIDPTSNKTIPHPERRDPVDTYKRRDLRAKISKEVKALSSALVAPSDKKHIPPKLTAAVADFLKEFTNDTSVFSAAKLATLRQAYDRLSDSGEDSDMDISYAYDPDISTMIGELSDAIDGRRLAQLDIDETTKVKNIVQHFRHIVREENGVFVEGRRRNVAALGTEIMGELGQRKATRTNPTSMRAFEAFKDMLTSGNITPAYFFKRVGGAMEQLFKTVRNGQNDWANNMKRARQVYESAFRKYHADSWLNKKGDALTFESERGDNITLTRQQALTLYATHQREVTNQIQEAGHLSLGGFVYEDAVKPKRGQAPVDTTKAHPLSAGDMAKIIDWLTDEQIKFADEMVGYMSGDLAKLGNETSMQLHGWEKFTESYYFPYNSAENYLYTKQAVSDDRRLKHMSFTKATVRKANNPIVLSDFTQVWANHVQNMLMYSSLAVPLENFNRVYNYKTSVTEDSTSRSVKEALEKAYGKRANAYINQLLTDINGGVRPNPSETFIGSMLSKFKKSAVFASASVVVQQPSAIGRAMALIHPKYFVATTFNRRMWEECKEHCGVALIKEMGRFDTNTGRGASEWLIAQPYKGVQKIGAFVTDSEYRDEVLSSPAAKADAYTWASIWNACKREAVKEKGLKPNSEELFKAAAERFDEVVNFTQVYDSVFARSELMRSKSVGSQMLTSFMAEPTVSYNLLYDAFANAKRGDVKSKVHPARAVGAFILSATLNSILKSIVTAARDDDEDKTYIEKYLGELVENFSSDANPLNLIPYVRDVLSLIRGYSVDNSAYELPSMIIDAADDLDNEKKTGAEKLRGLAEAISATFGVPLKNVLRDIDAITGTFFNTKPLTETSRGGILDSVLDKLPFYDNGNAANYARLYDAYIKGDAERADRISGRLTDSGVSESDIMSGLRKAAKEQYIAGGVSSDEASDFLAQHAGLDQNEAYWKVREWDYDSTKSEGDPNYSKYLRLRDALDADDLGEAHDAAVELLEHGVSVSSLKRELTSHLGSNQIIYELGLEDYLDGNAPKKDAVEEANEEQEEDSGKRRGGRGGRGGSSATAAVTASTDASATAASTELPSIGSSEPLLGRRTAVQRVQKSIPGASSAAPLGTHAFGSASGGGRIYNEACDNFDGGQCRIGRSSCDNCPYSSN